MARHGSGSAGIDPSQPASALLTARIRAQVEELLALDAAVRDDADDAVHGMRVAARRLRSTLAAFRPLLIDERTEPVRAELRWLGRVLGEARDAQVLQRRLHGLVAEEPAELIVGPVSQRIDDELRGAYRAAHASVVAAFDSPRGARLLDALGALAAEPPLRPRAERPAEEVLRKCVRRELRRVRRRAAAAADAPTGERDAQLHDVRRAAKRARYAVEALEPAYGRRAHRLAEALARVQAALGDQHDAVVAQAFLRETGMRAHLDGENSFSYGLLHARETTNAAAAAAAFVEAWAKASRKRLRRWLD